MGSHNDSSYNDGRVVKLDQNGKTLWSWNSGTVVRSGADIAVNSVAIRSDGQIIVGMGSHNDSSYNDGKVVKLDQNGNTLWNWSSNYGAINSIYSN